MFFYLKHPIRCCVFSVLQVCADFLSNMPNKAKKVTFLQNVQIFDLILHGILKVSKNVENEKTQQSNDFLSR